MARAHIFKKAEATDLYDDRHIPFAPTASLVGLQFISKQANAILKQT